MYSIPLQHSPCGEHCLETGTCDKTERRHSHRQAKSWGERGRKIRSDGEMQRERERESQEGGRVLCNSWEFNWFGKTSPLITGQNQPAGADTVAGNSKHPTLSRLPSLSLSHLPSRFSSRKCKCKHTGDWTCKWEAAVFGDGTSLHLGLIRLM